MNQVSERVQQLRAHTDIVVARARDGAIGVHGELLVPIREDLRRFKRLTAGDTVIYGRKTLATFPGAKPLVGRRNLILSRSLRTEDLGELPAGTEAQIVSSLEELEALLLQALPEQAGLRKRFHIIGGAQVYTQLLPWAGVLHITEIDLERPDADAWLDDEVTEGFRRDWQGPWMRAGKVKPFAYRYLRYTREA